MVEGMLRETGMESPWKRPFMFQQYVAGRSLRAYTLGGQVSSMGVVRSDEKRVDWRAGPVQVERVEPEEALKLQIAKAVKLLGLSFCSIDIEHDDSDGKYYLLDFNPGALFTGWEPGNPQDAGNRTILDLNVDGLVDVSDAIYALLTESTASHAA